MRTKRGKKPMTGIAMLGAGAIAGVHANLIHKYFHCIEEAERSTRSL
jgi:hypothetical protein